MNSSEAIAGFIIANGLTANKLFITQTVFVQWLGINDMTEDEISSIMSSSPQYLAYRLAKLVSSRAQIGWATHGHSAVDVNLVRCIN